MRYIGELGGKVGVVLSTVVTQGFGVYTGRPESRGRVCEDACVCVCVRTVWSEGKTEASQLLWVTSDWLKRFLCIGKVNTLLIPSLPGVPYT